MEKLEQELNAYDQPLPPHWKRAIAIIWTGQAVSILATCAATFAVIWYITTASDSALILSLAGIAALLPVALVAPFGGLLADRFDKRRVMILADGIAGAFSLVLAIVTACGYASIPLLLLLLAVRATAQGFHGPSLMALMPQLVPERDMVRINTLDQTLSSGSAIIGPVLGIALYTAFGFVAVLAFDALCALLACICLAMAHLPYAKSEMESTSGVWGDMREGILLIKADKSILALLAVVMLAMLLFLPLGTLSPLMTYDWFGGNGFQASMVEAAAGIGLLLGSVIMLIWGGDKKLVGVFVTAGILLGICCIAAGLLPNDGFPAFVALVCLMFAATAMFNAPIIPLMQRRIPSEKFGRTMGLFGALTAAASPVGLAIAGPVAEAITINRWFVLAGAILCIAMLLSLLLKDLRMLDNVTEDEGTMQEEAEA